jgi:hypothetical protein
LHQPHAAPHPLPVLTVLGGGTLALAAGVVAGGNATAVGALAFLAATFVALGQTSSRLVTWPNAFLVFIAALWFVPIKLYRFPVDLPFHLELYRVMILALVVAFLVNSLVTKRHVESLGAGPPLFLLAATALAAQIVNAQDINVPGTEGQAVKSLSMLLSLIVVFLLVASTIKTFREIELLVIGLVIGGAIVAAAALYESRTQYNVFNHLHQWVPVLDRNERDVLALRGGNLRVHASAQHPIALGAVLMMVLPLAGFLALKAKDLSERALWIVCAFLIIAGAAATISRTVVIMGIAMAIAAYVVRREVVVRALPLLLVLPLFVHAAAPGSLGSLRAAFGSQEGTTFVGSFQTRGGEVGSGRLADIDPGLRLWATSPIVGLGLDNPRVAVSGEDAGVVGPGASSSVPIIFDNQYMTTLVTLGVAGLIALSWFVWGTAVRLIRAARRYRGLYGDFIAACALACVGYGVSMFVFDAVAYIQLTLVLFMTAAFGLRTVKLAEQEASATRPAPAA